jgi:phosphoenolpyruvate carboxylase
MDTSDLDLHVELVLTAHPTARADATADRQALSGTVTGIAFGLRNTG